MRSYGCICVCVFLWVSLFTPNLPAQFVKDWINRNRSETFQKEQNIYEKIRQRLFWNGKGANLIMDLTNDAPEMRRGLGLSDEQWEQLHQAQEAAENDFNNSPLANEYRAEMEKFNIKDDPYLLSISEEAKREYLELQENLFTKLYERRAEAIEKIITLEQRQKIKEFQLATMSVMPYFDGKSFEALGLSESQKEQMRQIHADMSADYEKTLDELVVLDLRRTKLLTDAVEKSGIETAEEFNEKLRTIAEELEQENPEYKNIPLKMRDKGKEFMDRLKFRMFDVLTDEQLERLSDLLDHPPAHAKKFIETVRKYIGEQEPNRITPGFLDAWQPGDPIPEEYKEHRKAKFPKKT